MNGGWLRVAHRRRSLFLGITLVLATTLGWLGWRLLAQDEQLARQRAAEQRESAADLIVAGLSQRLSALEQSLPGSPTLSEVPPAVSGSDDAVLVRIGPNGIDAVPTDRLLFYPDVPPKGADLDPVFATADELEFRRNDAAAVVALLRPYAANHDADIAASALVRIARNQSKGGEFRAAAETFEQLGRLGPVLVGEMPAAIAAHVGRMSVWEQAKDTVAAKGEAEKLSAAMRSGTWKISRATYLFLDGEVRRLIPDATRPAAEQVALTEATEWLSEQWNFHQLAPAGRRSLNVASGRALLVWRSSATEVVSILVGSGYLRDRWLTGMSSLLEARRARVAMTTPEGAEFLGSLGAADRPAVRLASATGLPWTIQVANSSDDPLRNDRRVVLIAVLGVLLGLILVGAWFIDQTVARELALADMQSDFVSAVSHEFRTPLTTLCQLSELLTRGRVASDDDRAIYYRLLHDESQRLKRLVETLLNFGRLEAGRMHFRFEPVSPTVVVREVVDEFARTEQGSSRRIDVTTDGEAAMVSADRDMLRSVVWNLVENAAKYSSSDAPIAIALSRSNGHVRLAVSDQGVGIPRSEHRRIFEKFVRGSAARASDVRGTGVGLAVTQRIVAAHGGEVAVASEPGRGSTFTVMLPAMASGSGLQASAAHNMT
jgi:signal transduction histidine kinase